MADTPIPQPTPIDLVDVLNFLREHMTIELDANSSGYYDPGYVNLQVTIRVDGEYISSSSCGFRVQDD